ncbi:MAG: hypothetical protein WDM71_10300 [Ferruginibacter sp.]
MDNDLKYSITLEEKVPIISNLITDILGLCGIILVLCWLLFGPPLSTNNEMQVVAIVRIIPDGIMRLFFYLGIGFIIALILNRIVKIHELALLSFDSENILINSKRRKNVLPISDIPKIELIDPRDSIGVPDGIFTVIIHQLDANNIEFRLNDYSDSDKFIDALLTYDHLKTRLDNLERDHS